MHRPNEKPDLSVHPVKRARHEELKRKAEELDAVFGGPHLDAARDIYEAETDIDLASIDDPESLLNWVDEELDRFFEQHDGYLASIDIRRFFQGQLFPYLAARKGAELPTTAIDIHCDEVFTPDGHGDGRVTGNVSLMGEAVLRYSIGDDGSGGRITGFDRARMSVAIQRALERFPAPPSA